MPPKMSQKKPEPPAPPTTTITGCTFTMEPFRTNDNHAAAVKAIADALAENAKALHALATRVAGPEVSHGPMLTIGV